MTDENTIQSIRRVFDIINVLAENPHTSLSTIAERTELPKSTVHNHLTTLQSLDLVRQEERKYICTTRFLEIAGRHRKNLKIYQVARRAVEELAMETGGYGDLYIEESGDAILLHLSMGTTPVELGFAYEGMRQPLHTHASGLAILAFQSEDYIADIIEWYQMSDSVSTTIDEGSLYERLSEIGERKFSIDDEQAMVGMRGIGAPITSRSGTAVAAISIYKPVNEMSSEYFRTELPELVKKKANFIEVNLNYN